MTEQLLEIAGEVTSLAHALSLLFDTMNELVIATTALIALLRVRKVRKGPSPR